MKLPEKPPRIRDYAFDHETKETEPEASDWRRILNESLNSKKTYDNAIKFNRDYLYWSELKYKIKDEQERKNTWHLMKLFRLGKYENINLNLNSKKTKYSLIKNFEKKLHELDKFLAGNFGTGNNELKLEQRYIINSLIEESIASSMIEGATTTRKVAKKMLRQKRKPRTKDERMILNNYETMKYVSEIKNKQLTPELLLKIQREITKTTLENPNHEGSFRNSNDIVVGSSVHVETISHVPPPCEQIKLLTKEICKFANDDSGEFVHPIIKGIILHFLIAYVHPFNDGNGRTARSIFYWYVLSKDYWLFEYMPISRVILRSRKKYDLAYLYTEQDEMDLTYFIKYNIQCIDQSLNDLREYVKKKQKEQKSIEKILSENPHLNLRQATILKKFMENPDNRFTIEEISTTYKVVYQTARTDLLLLADKKFVNKRLISGKKFAFSLNQNQP